MPRAGLRSALLHQIQESWGWLAGVLLLLVPWGCALQLGPRSERQLVLRPSLLCEEGLKVPPAPPREAGLQDRKSGQAWVLLLVPRDCARQLGPHSERQRAEARGVEGATISPQGWPARSEIMAGWSSAAGAMELCAATWSALGASTCSEAELTLPRGPTTASDPEAAELLTLGGGRVLVFHMRDVCSKNAMWPRLAM